MLTLSTKCPSSDQTTLRAPWKQMLGGTPTLIGCLQRLQGALLFNCKAAARSVDAVTERRLSSTVRGAPPVAWRLCCGQCAVLGELTVLR